MNVLVSASARFIVTRDNQLWTNSPSLGYHFWTRYLDVYENVYLLVRAQRSDVTRPEATLTSGHNVYPLILPYYHGPAQFVLQAPSLKRIVGHAIENAQAIHLRVPCAVGNVVAGQLPNNRPYGVEVVGDPYDVFAPGSVRHPLRPFFRWWFSRQLRLQCSRASGVAYVTAQALQLRYPPTETAFTTHYSSVELPEAAFISVPHTTHSPHNQFNLILVGSLEHYQKAPDVLLDAVEAALRSDLKLRLVIVGEGKYRSALETQAESLGIAQHVTFVGQVPAGEAVRAELDKADLFVLPSRQEGLPRAMIEAMARGLPCIGSTVGGIPELLPPEDMVPPGDAVALANKICEVLANPDRMAKMSARNLEKAKEYRDDVLRARRKEFYSFIRDATHMWLKQHARPI